MNTKRNLLLALGGLTLVIGGAVANRRQTQELKELPSNPEQSPIELLDAQPFELDEPALFTWRKETPSFDSGYLLVLKADPELARSRQGYEPVLYVGQQVAERCNRADVTGHMVVVVPTPEGQANFDPTQEAIWFGTPELPELVDQTRITEEHTKALAQGVTPPNATRLAARTLRPDGSPEAIHVADRDQLNLFVADLIELYSPEEMELVSLLRMPRNF